MAGYIIALDSEESLKKCFEEGVYSTDFKELKNNYWKIHHEGTFADYLGMKAGDNIYFFIKRCIYGIGELVNIKDDCKYLNYIDSDIPIKQKKAKIKSEILVIGGGNDLAQYRCICTFRASPNFFKQGIDMDDALASNPTKFKMLRAFWKLSFIKIDDEENKALRDIILKRNEEAIGDTKKIFKFNNRIHYKIENKVNEKYRITASNILGLASDKEAIKHEMAIECGILENLNNGSESIFGKWNYITHQVVASPFKPIDYMDKMDVFGYRYISGYDTISKYLIIEIKREKAGKEALDQVMKYVDWVNQEYSFGDYSMVQAYLVAYDFDEEVIAYKNNVCIRNYIKGRRPVISETWSNLRLVKYRYKDGNLVFEEIK